MARYGIRAPRAATALALLLMMYVAGVHSVTTAGAQTSSSLRNLRELADNFPGMFAHGGPDFTAERARAHGMWPGDSPLGRVQPAPEADQTYAHLNSPAAIELAGRALDARGPRQANMRMRRLVTELYHAHAADERVGEFDAPDKTDMLEMAGYVNHPHATREQRVEHLLALAHHSARHMAAAHARGELDAFSGAAEHPSAVPEHGPGSNPSFVEAGAQGKAGMNLIVMSVLGLVQGLLTIFFGKETFGIFKACSQQMAENFGKSDGALKFKDSLTRLAGASKVTPPIFTPAEIFHAFPRPINGVYSFTAPDATALYFRYKGPRNLHKYSPQQLDAMYKQPERLPACWEWAPPSVVGDRVWMPSSTLVVSSGMYKGQKPVAINQGLIKWLQMTCPHAPELTEDDVGKLLGRPNARGVYEYEAEGPGWFDDVTLHYRRVGGAWQWSKGGDHDDAWHSVRSRSQLKFDHVHIAKYLADRNPTGRDLEHYVMLDLGAPSVEGDWAEYSMGVGSSRVYFRKSVSNTKLAWQYSFGAGFKNIDRTRAAPSRLSAKGRELYSYLERVNPAAPSALEQAQHTGDTASAFNPNSFMQVAERVANAFIKMTQAVPEWLGDTVGGFTKCFAETRGKCFGEGKEGQAAVAAAEADQDKLLAETKALETQVGNRLRRDVDVGEAVEGSIDRRALYDEVPGLRSKITEVGYGSPDSLEMYYQANDVSNLGPSFVEANATASAAAGATAESEAEMHRTASQAVRDADTEFPGWRSWDAKTQLDKLREALDEARAPLVAAGHPWAEAHPDAHEVHDAEFEALLQLDSVEAESPLSALRRHHAAARRASSAPAFVETEDQDGGNTATATSTSTSTSTSTGGGSTNVVTDEQPTTTTPAGGNTGTAADEEAARQAKLAELDALFAEEVKASQASIVTPDTGALDDTEAQEKLLSNLNKAAKVGAPFSKNPDGSTTHNDGTDPETGEVTLENVDLENIDFVDIPLELFTQAADVLGTASEESVCAELEAETSQGTLLIKFTQGIVGAMALWKYRVGVKAGLAKVWRLINVLTFGVPRMLVRMSTAMGKFLYTCLKMVVRAFAVPFLALWKGIMMGFKATYGYILRAAAAVGSTRAGRYLASGASRLARGTGRLARGTAMLAGNARDKVLKAGADVARYGKGAVSLLKNTRAFRVARVVTRRMGRTAVGRILVRVLRGLAKIGVRLGAKAAALATPGFLIGAVVLAGFIALNVYVNWKDITECCRNIQKIMAREGGQGFWAKLMSLKSDEVWDLSENVGRLLVKIFI